MTNNSDIVAELDRWLEDEAHPLRWPLTTLMETARLMKRARDEIVTWRVGPFALAMTERGKFIRAEALEEAAQVCEKGGAGGRFSCAAAIRALKEKP